MKSTPTADPRKAVAERMGAVLKTIPHGQLLLHDKGLKDAQVKIVLSGGDRPMPYGEPKDTEPDPPRIPEARALHRRRERGKARLREYCVKHKLQCPASPQRTDIDMLGGGGGMSLGVKPPGSPLPEFPSVNPLGLAEEVAQEAAWLSQPFRIGGESQTLPVKCEHCQELNSLEELECIRCGKRLPHVVPPKKRRKNDID
jgi:hypothetical protein